MSASPRSFYTMEALALVSALVIAGIFVFSHFARQAAASDDLARRVSQQVPAVAEAFFSANPEGRLSAEALQSGGLRVTPPVRFSIPAQEDRADNWRVEVWHPGGEDRYLVGPSGITTELR